MQQQTSLGSWPRAELERLGEKTKRPMERVLIESYDSQKAMSSFNIASATVHEFGNVRPPNSPARRLPEKAYRHWHPWQPSQERQRQVRTNRHCSIGCGRNRERRARARFGYFLGSRIAARSFSRATRGSIFRSAQML